MLVFYRGFMNKHIKYAITFIFAVVAFNFCSVFAMERQAQQDQGVLLGVYNETPFRIYVEIKCGGRIEGKERVEPAREVFSVVVDANTDVSIEHFHQDPHLNTIKVWLVDEHGQRKNCVYAGTCKFEAYRILTIFTISPKRDEDGNITGVAVYPGFFV